MTRASNDSGRNHILRQGEQPRHGLRCGSRTSTGRPPARLTCRNNSDGNGFRRSACSALRRHTDNDRYRPPGRIDDVISSGSDVRREFHFDGDSPGGTCGSGVRSGVTDRLKAGTGGGGTCETGGPNMRISTVRTPALCPLGANSRSKRQLGPALPALFTGNRKVRLCLAVAAPHGGKGAGHQYQDGGSGEGGCCFPHG